MRQPVIAYVLLTPSTRIVRFATSGATAAIETYSRISVDELAVDVVGDDEQVLLDDDLRERLDLRARVDRAGRVRRVVEHDRARARRARGGDLLGGHGEVVLGLGLEDDRPAAGEHHHVGVADPVRRRDRGPRRPDRAAP